MTTLLPMEPVGVPYRLPADFETFYRATVRRVCGARLRSTALHERYMLWAMANGGSSVSLKQQRDHLEAIGHRRVASNGIHYCDIAFVEDAPGVADTLTLPIMCTLPTNRRDDRAAAAMLAKVDAALASLLDLRRAIVSARETVAPHVAAQLALGIGDM